MSDLPVFPTHFNPNNSLLILLQISLLFLCTRLNCKPFEKSEMSLMLKWVRLASISCTGISYLMNSPPASIRSFTELKSTFSASYNVSYKPNSTLLVGQRLTDTFPLFPRLNQRREPSRVWCRHISQGYYTNLWKWVQTSLACPW